MRWKNAFFSVVVCTQVCLVTILVYLIWSCNKVPKPFVILGRTAAKVNDLEDVNHIARTTSKTVSAFKVFPTASLEGQTSVVSNNKFVNEKLYDSETPMKKRTLQEKDTFISYNNSVDTRPRKPRLKLLVSILSAPIRFDRREGIRRTWMKYCTFEEVVCRFFTDSLSDMEPKVRTALANESAKYDDLEFMPIPKGYNFGLRLMWLMEWSMERYDFDFFLRMDDDYFVCLKRLLFEIPFRPQKR